MRTWILSGLALATVGCSTLAPANWVQPGLPRARAANAGVNLYPIGVGTRWDYRLTQYRDGVATGRIDTMSNQVVLSRLSADGAQAKIERRYGQMAVPATEALVTAKSVRLARWQDPPPSETPAIPTGAGSPPPTLSGGIRGLFAFAAPRQTLTDQELTTSIEVLHYPLVPGESWTGRVWTFARETLTARGWEPVTVPAGTFNAWHVAHQVVYQDGRTDNLGYWYVPDVGMIKAHEETAMPMNGTLVRFAVDGELTGSTLPLVPQARLGVR